jgi:hypothetical protein
MLKSHLLDFATASATAYLIFALSTTNVVNEVKITTQNTSYKEYRLKTNMKSYKFIKKDHQHYTR